MDCTEIRPLISYYYDGEATPEEQARVERHVATCEECRRVLAEYRAIGGGLREMALPAPPVGLRRDVWRAIEAQQIGAGARVFGAPQPRPSKRPQGKVVQFPQPQHKPGFAGALANFESGWSKALTAALVIGALFVVLGVLVILQRGTPTQAASLIDKQPFTDYGQVLHIQFNKDVKQQDAQNYTTVDELVNGRPQSVDSQIKKEYTRNAGAANGILAITPLIPWDAGATYTITVDAPNIGLNVQGNDKMAKDPVMMTFTTVALTPTPTDTVPPTDTPQPTNTTQPTRQPTAVAQNTEVATAVVPGSVPSSTAVVQPSATTAPPRPSATTAPRPSPTNTHVVPTSTPIPPTETPVPPSATPTHEPEPTNTPAVTATATATPIKGTPTPKPVVGTPTPTPACNIMPVNGFGKVWNEHPADVRDRVGCPTEHETALEQAAAEQFQGGYMFWRGDTSTIYVFFFGSPNDTVGTWEQFPDTWKDGDPEPTPDQPAPSGLYIPVRGFGKLWNENSNVRELLGYAIEEEHAMTGAWQAYQHGYALWTSDKVIRFLFTDNSNGSNIYERFEDTFIMPTATPTH